MIKRIMIALLVCSFAFGMVACVQKKDTVITKAETDFSKVPRATKFLTETINPSDHPVRMVTVTQKGGEEQRTEIGTKGKEYYMEFNTEDLGKVSIIFKDNVVYSISHNDKLALESKNVSSVAGGNLLDTLKIKKEDLNGSEVTTGSDELNGQYYEYEEFFDGKKKKRFFFEGDVCKGIKTTEDGVTETTIIEAYDQNVEDSKLVVPEGYTIETAN